MCPGGQDCYCFQWNCRRLSPSGAVALEQNSSDPPSAAPRKLWDCPAGYVGNDECLGESSDCCGDSTPGWNCPDGQDCYCFAWNCDRRLSHGVASPAEVGNNTLPPAEPRKLWNCPAGYVGKYECLGENSDCCGDSTVGTMCPGGQDCYCFQWNCRRLSPSGAVALEQNSSDPPSAAPRKLWDCPAGYVGNDECLGESSDCCGDSTPGWNCPDGQDCYCFAWNCDRRLSMGSAGVSKPEFRGKFLAQRGSAQ